MINRDAETDCINRVLGSVHNLHGKARDFIELLANMKRTKNESPDFIFKSQPESNTNNNLIIGVEHFVVDHLSIKLKNGKISSQGAIRRKEFDSFSESNVGKVDDKNLLEATKELAHIIAKQYADIRNSGYWDFIATLKTVLNKHLLKVNDYRKNLRQQSDKNFKIKIAFLIEIHAEFLQLFLNDKKGTYKNPLGNLPIFEDFIKVLDELTVNKIDYIVLNVFNAGQVRNNTIVLRAGFIRKDLATQKINIYHYVAEDMLISPFDMQGAESRAVSAVEKKGDNFIIKLTLTQHDRDRKQHEALVLYAIYRAWWCRKNFLNFACAGVIQEYLEVYYPYIIDWQKPKNFQADWEVVPKVLPMTMADIDSRVAAFENEWGINANNNKI